MSNAKHTLSPVLKGWYSPAWCPKSACTATSAMPPGGPSTASATTAAGLALHACAAKDAIGGKGSLIFMRSLEDLGGNDRKLQPAKTQGALVLLHPFADCWPTSASSDITQPVFPPPDQWIWLG